MYLSFLPANYTSYTSSKGVGRIFRVSMTDYLSERDIYKIYPT